MCRPVQEAHIAKLRPGASGGAGSAGRPGALDTGGDASLQNALDLAVDSLRGVPPYGQRCARAEGLWR